MLEKRSVAPWLIAAAVLIFYGNSLLGRFTFDDSFVLNKAAIHTVGLQSARYWFPPVYYSVSGERSYRPMCTLTYFLQGRVERLFTGNPGQRAPQFSPFFFKAGNLMLHFLAALLLWRLARCWLDASAALFAALLFAVYPATTEAVNGVGFREDLLVAVFIESAALLYLRWCRSPRKWFPMAGSMLCFVLGILSKENAFVFPGLLILTLAAWPTRPRNKAAWIGTVPFVLAALAAAYLLLVLFRNRVVVPYAWLEGYDGARWKLAGPLLAAHLRTLVFPYPLIADRTFLAAEQGTCVSPLWVTIAAGVVLMSVAVWAWRKDRGLFAALIWVVVPLAPVIGLVRLGVPVADRYCYLSCLGIGLLGGRLAALAAVRGRGGRLLAILLALVIAVCGAATATRNVDWCSESALWTRTLAQNPRSVKAHENIGVLLMQEGDAGAIPHLSRACDLDPSDWRLQENLAVAYAIIGQVPKAIEIAEKALRPDALQPSLLSNLSVMYMNKPDPSPERASAYYERSLSAGATPDPAFEARLKAGMPSGGESTRGKGE